MFVQALNSYNSAMIAASALARLWLAFGGLVFVLMGLSLAGDAEAHARAAAAWREALAPAEPPDRPRRLVWAYRLFGGSFCALGLWLMLGWEVFGARAFPRLGGASPAARAAGGMALLALGLALAALRLWEWRASRAPRFVEAEAPRTDGFGPRLAFWSSWLLIGSFIAFGGLLLSPYAR